MYEYDDAGTLVRSITRVEPEWDEQERAWAVALRIYEDTLCPLCGRPMSVCTDPDTEGRWSVGAPTRCFATTAVERAREPYGGGKTNNPGALMFAASVSGGDR